MDSFISFGDDDSEQIRNLKHFLIHIDNKLDFILKYLNVFYKKENKMAFDISGLVQAVERERTVEASMKAAMVGMAQKIAELSANVVDDATKAKLADLASQLNLSSDDMAAAVAANTPTVTPTVTPAPAPAPEPTPAPVTDTTSA